MEQNDLLSDIFKVLRLNSEIYFRTELSGDWGIEIPADSKKIRFHIVLQGRCVTGVVGSGETTELNVGDMVLVPHGKAHILADKAGQDIVKLNDVLENYQPDEDGILRVPGSGASQTRILCGFCSFDEALDHPILKSLPDYIEILPNKIGNEPWLSASLRLLAMESDLAAQGMSSVLTRLIEVVIIQSIRANLNSPNSFGANYINALSDLNLGVALNHIHNHPEKKWTLQSLAKAAGLSKTVFAERFANSVGLPPISYLTEWRLMKSRQMLKETGMSIDNIALCCGYASLPSFTRRFTNTFGIGPGAFRKTHNAF